MQYFSWYLCDNIQRSDFALQNSYNEKELPFGLEHLRSGDLGRVRKRAVGRSRGQRPLRKLNVLVLLVRALTLESIQKIDYTNGTFAIRCRAFSRDAGSMVHVVSHFVSEYPHFVNHVCHFVRKPGKPSQAVQRVSWRPPRRWGSGEIDILLTAEATAVSTPVQARRIAADGARVAMSITCFSNEVKNVKLGSDIVWRVASTSGILSAESARRWKSISKSRNFSLVKDDKRWSRCFRKSIARIRTVTGQARCDTISEMIPRYSGALVISRLADVKSIALGPLDCAGCASFLLTVRFLTDVLVVPPNHVAIKQSWYSSDRIRPYVLTWQ